MSANLNRQCLRRFSKRAGRVRLSLSYVSMFRDAPSVSDVVAIGGTFEMARQETHAAAILPDASRIWWFAQLRARREAAQEAGRPILATEMAAFAWAVGLVAVCVGTALRWFQAVRGWLGAIVEGMDAKVFLAEAISPFVEHGVLIIGGMALVILLPAAAYLAMGKE